MQDGSQGQAEKLELVGQDYGLPLISCIDRKKPKKQILKIQR